MSGAFGTRPLRWLLAAALLGGCQRDRPERESEHVPAGRVADAVRVGELQPGAATPGMQMSNPFRNSAQAERGGEHYFTWFNCAGCHGALGGGGIGPPLRDADWIYGGDDAQVYLSILQGRPNGMPAYGGRMPDEVAWQIIAYIRSLERASHGNGNDSPTEAEGGA